MKYLQTQTKKTNPLLQQQQIIDYQEDINNCLDETLAKSLR